MNDKNLANHTPEPAEPGEVARVVERQTAEELERERYELLQQVEDWLETPVQVLGFVWLGLLVIELTLGLSPILNAGVWVIWGIFVVDFAIRFILAPRKLRFLRSNWLTVLSLLVPALRVFAFARALRILRLSRATRSLRLVKVVGSLNRGLKALRASMSRRGFGYVMILTIAVTLVGAAGMFAFESQSTTPGFANYADSLWWTAMLMTTLGSEFWPRTAEGRILSFLLSLYAFAIFGYVTAALASFFIGREAAAEEGDVASEESVRALHREIQALRSEISALSGKEPGV